MNNNNPVTQGHPLSRNSRWRDDVIHREDSCQQTMLEGSGKGFFEKWDVFSTFF